MITIFNTTLMIIIQQIALNLPLVMGSYISIALLKIPDLSIESAYTFGAITGAQATLLMNGAPIALTLLVASCSGLLGGLLVGFVSSLLTTKIGFSHLLSSIITIGIFHGINQFFLGSCYLSLSNVANPLESIAGSIQHPELPILILIMVLISGVLILFLKTQLSYAAAFYGDNPTCLPLFGINKNFVLITNIMISNALAGLSGYLVAQSNGLVELSMGSGKVLLCITTLIIGNSLRNKKIITLKLPLIGLIGYFTIQQLLLKIGFDLKYFTMFQTILVALLLAYNYKKQSKTVQPHDLGI